MSSVLSLPQELKLAILLQATNENEPRRNEILRTASLVQTSFRGLSQALLAREIQILDEEQLRPVEDALQQAPFRHIKTHSLQFRGNLESLLAGKGRNRWMELESLRFVTSKNEIDLELVCKLSNLRTLHLSDGVVLSISTSTSFLHLTRLILAKNLFPTKTTHTSSLPFFPRAAFPALRHLSLLEFRPLCPIDNLLSELLPVISSLSIFEPHSSSIERILSRLENCEHVALRCRNEDLRQLLLLPNPRFRMKLESLHLQAEGGAFESKLDWRELQARGMGRIVVYESREGEDSEVSGDERIEWRRGRLCVEDFDGR